MFSGKVTVLCVSSHRGNRPDPRTRLATARLYLCTDARRDTGDLARFVEEALAGGVDIVQLRDKDSAGEKKFGRIEARDELAALEVIADACARHGALLAVNDRADLALTAGADILHLGQGDLPVAQARRIVGDEMIIGRSTTTRGQAALADLEEGVDYFASGPVWDTPTKPGRTANGLEVIREVVGLRPRRPWFAIGGVDLERLPQLVEAGVGRIAVVRAITKAEDPRAAAAALAAALGGTSQ